MNDSLNNNLKIVKGSKNEHLDFIKELASELVPYATWYHENFLQLFNKNNHLTMVLEKNGEPVSFCSFILQENTADVDLTATKKECWGQGYGTLLFKRGIENLKKIKIEKVFLEVAENNEMAQNFYQKLGFVKLDRVIKKYYNDGQDAFVYLLKL